MVGIKRQKVDRKQKRENAATSGGHCLLKDWDTQNVVLYTVL